MDRPDERSDARERALYLLYEAHSKGIAPSATIDLQVVEPDPLTQELVRGVDAKREQIDALIAAKAKGWSLERMPVLDLSVMRLASFPIHADNDTEETADLWHGSILYCPRVVLLYVTESGRMVTARPARHRSWPTSAVARGFPLSRE